MSEERNDRPQGNQGNQGTWPIAKQWPDTAFAQMIGQWFRLAHVGDGYYEIVDGPFQNPPVALPQRLVDGGESRESRKS